MRIGIYGGTFDPVHRGHLHIAKQAFKWYSLDRILWIPTYAPPHKKMASISPFDHRFNMLKLSIAGHSNQSVLSLEKERRGISYTADTISILKNQYPTDFFFLLLGSDMTKSISTWYNWEQLLNWVTPIVFVRGKNVLKKPQENIIDPQLPTKYINQLKNAIVPVNTLPISSTLIRNTYQKGEALSSLILPQVEDYIIKNSLYKDYNLDNKKLI